VEARQGTCHAICGNATGKTMTDKLKEAYLEGYAEGKSVEELSDISRKTAKERFERWQEINDIGEGDD
jgi:hypothetical protein